MTKEEIIRNYYSGWEKKEWRALESLLADGFTFTSPNNDDHIDKRAFRAKCWPQADWIERFELESVVRRDDEAFVKYLCRTKNGRSFRNVEYFRFARGKVKAVECYFGGHTGYPSAASLDLQAGNPSGDG
jgi:SnoaL-like domain